MPDVGFKSWVGVGEESVYGTPVAITNWNEIISESMGMTRVPTPKSSMRRGSPSNFFQPTKQIGGTINFELMFEGYLKWLKHLFGSVATVETEAATRWTHTFTINNDLPTGLTVEIYRVLQSFQYHGIMVNQGNFTLEADQTLKMDLELIGEDESKISASTPTFPTELLAQFAQGVFTIDATPFDVDTCNFQLNNGLIARPKVGSATTKRPARNELREVSGSFAKDWETADIAAIYDKWAAGTPVVLKLDITGPTLGAGNYKITLDVPRAVLQGEPPKIGGPGVIKTTIPWQGFYDEAGTQDAIKLTVVNGQSSV